MGNCFSGADDKTEGAVEVRRSEVIPSTEPTQKPEDTVALEETVEGSDTTSVVEIEEVEVEEVEAPYEPPPPKIERQLHEENPDVLREGCYLVYESRNRGNLYMVWSKTPIKNALGYFSPLKQQSEIKYTHNAGRTLIKGNANEKKIFYAGWMEFVKLALNAYCASEIHILAAEENNATETEAFRGETRVMIVLLEAKTNICWTIVAGQYLECSAELVIAAAIVSPECAQYEVGSHSMLHFMEIGRLNGEVFTVSISEEQVSAAKSHVPPAVSSKALPSTNLTGEPNMPGAYLILNHEIHSLTIEWSEDGEQPAVKKGCELVAFFIPTREVAKFKYKKPTELKKNVADRKQFYGGVSEFIREGLLGCQANMFYFFEGRRDKVSVYWLEKDNNNVHRHNSEGWWSWDIDVVAGVAVMSPDITIFEVITMAPKLFTQKALDNGAFFDMIAVSERMETRSKSVLSTIGSNSTSPKIASRNQREESASPSLENSGAVDEASSPKILTEVTEQVTEQDFVAEDSIAAEEAIASDKISEARISRSKKSTDSIDHQSIVSKISEGPDSRESEDPESRVSRKKTSTTDSVDPEART